MNVMGSDYSNEIFPMTGTRYGTRFIISIGAATNDRRISNTIISLVRNTSCGCAGS